MSYHPVKTACALLSGLLFGCSGDPASAPDYEVDLTAAQPPAAGEGTEPGAPADSPAATPSDGKPSETAPVLPTDVVWKGKIDKTAAVTFGTNGATGCKYTVTMSNVDVTLTLDGGGNVKSSVVTATMTEKTLAPCMRTPLTPRVLTHAYTAAGDPKPDLMLKLLPIKNGPTADLFFTGAADAPDTMKTKLKWVRTDSVNYAWTVQVESTLTRQP